MYVYSFIVILNFYLIYYLNFYINKYKKILKNTIDGF